MTPERLTRMQSVLAYRQPDLTLIADGIHKPRNLAALVRSADAVGIHRIYTVMPEGGYRHYRGTTRGADRWVERTACESFADALAQVKAAGMQVYAAHLSDSAVDYRDVDYTVPCALLLGAEKEGVSEEALAAADRHITIPMLGMVSSLNVSTAAGIILAEAQRQRQLAGMYASMRLSPDEAALTLFEWSNPEVAGFCRAQGWAYPDYDMQGQMVDAVAWNRAVTEGTARRRIWR